MGDVAEQKRLLIKSLFDYAKTSLLGNAVGEIYEISGSYDFIGRDPTEISGKIIFLGSEGLFVGNYHEPKSMQTDYPILGKTEEIDGRRRIEFLKLKADVIHTLEKEGAGLEGTYRGYWATTAYANRDPPSKKIESELTLKFSPFSLSESYCADLILNILVLCREIIKQ